MENLKIVVLLFDGITALDAVGPYEVLSKIPNSKIFFAALKQGQINCPGGMKLHADYSIEEISEADILLIPGGGGIDNLLENTEVLDWINRIHRTTKYTASVCTGSLLLGAAGILKNLKATSHWNHIEKLKKYRADPVQERYVIDGKIITSAGVSAGIDMALKLTALVGNESLAQMIQLAIEYDPMPPFNSGSPEKISKELLEAFLKINSQKDSAER
jgi:transcriptional regulator GlxA family with amidase domain